MIPRPYLLFTPHITHCVTLLTSFKWVRQRCYPFVTPRPSSFVWGGRPWRRARPTAIGGPCLRFSIFGKWRSLCTTALVPRYGNERPLNGSRPMICCACAASPSKPLYKSTDRPVRRTLVSSAWLPAPRLSGHAITVTMPSRSAQGRAKISKEYQLPAPSRAPGRGHRRPARLR